MVSLVDDLVAWNSFPWGTYIFAHMYDGLSRCFGKIKSYIMEGKNGKLRYRVSGFTAPFRIWIWETMPQLINVNSRMLNDHIPRILRWDQKRKIEWLAICNCFDVDKGNHRLHRLMRPIIDETTSTYYNMFLKYMASAADDLPVPLRPFIKYEYIVFSNRASPPRPPPSPSPSPVHEQNRSQSPNRDAPQGNDDGAHGCRDLRDRLERLEKVVYGDRSKDDPRVKLEVKDIAVDELSLEYRRLKKSRLSN